MGEEPRGVIVRRGWRRGRLSRPGDSARRSGAVRAGPRRSFGRNRRRGAEAADTKRGSGGRGPLGGAGREEPESGPGPALPAGPELSPAGQTPL